MTTTSSAYAKRRAAGVYRRRLSNDPDGYKFRHRDCTPEEQDAHRCAPTKSEAR